MEENRVYSYRSLSETLKTIKELEDPKIIAGGTDFLVRHGEHLWKFPHLVDIGAIKELKGISVEEDKVVLGALVTHQELADNPYLREHALFLVEAAREVGAPQIRNRGTLGGNLVNASPAADLAPPLIALGARGVACSASGCRSFLLQDFFLGPGKADLRSDELLCSVYFAKPKKNSAGSYVKIGQRRALAISVVGLAVFVTLDEEKKKILDIELSIGSVAPRPLLLKETRAVLLGQAVSSLPLTEAKRALTKEISPIDDIRGTREYRLLVSQVVLERALGTALLRLGVQV